MAERISKREGALPEAGFPKRRGLWSGGLVRVGRNRVALLSLTVILLFTCLAIWAPQIAPHDPQQSDLDHMAFPPMWETRAGRTGIPEHPLGTDAIGRDLLSRVIYGARASMGVALLSTMLATLVGTLIGLVAGYAGGRVENGLMRITDVFYAFPSMMFCIIVILVLRDTPAGKWLDGVFMLVLALSVIGWTSAARLVRGAVLMIKREDYIQAAQSIGAGNGRILFRHLMPNTLSPVLVWVMSNVPRMITVEAVLGYLGVGLSAAVDRGAFFVTSWGGLFLDGRRLINSQPWMLIAPAVCVGVISMAFTFLGDSLRDALDPRLRGMV